MFRSFLTTALRNIQKNRLYSVINILGLAVGLAASILILLFVRYELSYENWLPGANDIYSIQDLMLEDGQVVSQRSTTRGPLAAAMAANIPEIDQVVRVAQNREILKRGDAVFNEMVMAVDPGFFDLFQFQFLKGDSSTALNNTTNLVINETLARKYFGQENPMGQTLQGSMDNVYHIVGVIKDLPENTELDFQAISLLDVPSIPKPHYYDHWFSGMVLTYFTLNDGAELDKVNAGFDAFLVRVVPFEDDEGQVTDKFRVRGLPVSDLHLLGSTGGDLLPGGAYRNIITFTIVAFLVLGVAVFNFVNSSTAIAQLRAREVGLRKVLGASRKHLIQQFFGESAFLCLLAFLTALIFVELALPTFADYWNSPIGVDYLQDAVSQVGLFCLFVFIVFAAGLYPAIVLSNYRPSQVLISSKSNSSERAGLRKILVLVQFAVSIGLAIVASLIQMQFNFATNADLGFSKENKLVISGVRPANVADSFDAMRHELNQIPGVEGVTRSFDVPGLLHDSGRWVSADWLPERTGLRINPVDFEFFELYGIEFVTGRSFSRDYANDIYAPMRVMDGSDGTAINPANGIINRAALKQLEIENPEDIIGSTIMLGVDDGYGKAEMTIVGVVEDFKERTVREETSPNVYYVQPDRYSFATIALSGRETLQTVSAIEDVWAEFHPNTPIRAMFLDETLDNLYQSSARSAEMLFAFSMLAIVISAFGLYGLAAFTAVRRTREVGIRKTLGASSIKIVWLLVRQFSLPVIYANLIAWPVAWYFVNDWLMSFHYRIEIGAGVFLFIGFCAISLAWLTVGSHAYRVARTNPITALRYE
jgi:putative ABC transport system permease protein